MSILVNKDTRLIVQGITGKTGTFHTKQCVDYGTQVVAGPPADLIIGQTIRGREAARLEIEDLSDSLHALAVIRGISNIKNQ